MTKKKKLRAGELGKYFFLFIIPALAIYLIFSITPFLYTIYFSFTDYTDMNPVNLHFVGLKNYIKVFDTPPDDDSYQKFSNICNTADRISGSARPAVGGGPE